MENTKKMTTRSLIGLEQDKGKYLVSLCICDGYLKGMGIRRPKNIYGWYPFPFVRKLKLLQKEEDEQLQREQEQFFRVGNESELTQLILC